MNHSNLVIKQQKPRLWYLSIGFSLLLLFIGSYIIGRYLALEDLSSTKIKLGESQQLLLDAQQELANARESLVMQKQSSQVDNLSNQELVSSVKSLQQIQNNLEEELVFYRKIMAPELDQEGLVIDSMQISKTDKAEEFHFRMTLIQAGKQAQFLKGEVALKVAGVLNGENAEYNFRELGTFNAKQFQFQFKYFENIQGFIKLPLGFEAEKLQVTAQTKGKRKKQKAEKHIIWQPEESQNYVRQ